MILAGLGGKGSLSAAGRDATIVKTLTADVEVDFEGAEVADVGRAFGYTC